MCSHGDPVWKHWSAQWVPHGLFPVKLPSTQPIGIKSSESSMYWMLGNPVAFLQISSFFQMLCSFFLIWSFVLWVRLRWPGVVQCFEHLKLVTPSLYSSSSCLVFPACWLRMIVNLFSLKTRRLLQLVFSPHFPTFSHHFPTFSHIFPSLSHHCPIILDPRSPRHGLSSPGEVHHSQGPRLHLRGRTLRGAPGPTDAETPLTVPRVEVKI